MAQDTPRPSPQYKGGLCTLERQKAGNKTQRQELEDKGEADGNKGKRAGVFVGEGGGDRGLPLDREKTDVA